MGNHKQRLQHLTRHLGSRPCPRCSGGGVQIVWLEGPEAEAALAEQRKPCPICGREPEVTVIQWFPHGGGTDG